MYTVFWNSLFRQGKTKRPVSIMLLIGLSVTILCISLMLGYTFGQYETTAGYTSYATLTVVPGSDIGANVVNFSTWMNEHCENAIANVLYISKTDENEILIGWHGNTANRWFPYTSGRFFTEQEQLTGENVAFISDNYYAGAALIDEVDINGEIYKVIGSGWIEKFNIQTAIAKDCPVNIFSTGPDETPYVKIIPYKQFAEHDEPDLILLHFDFASTKDLKKYAREIESVYSDTKIYFPNNNSDDVLTTQQISGVARALMICIIASITLIQLARLWGDTYKSELYVYHICGLNRLKCMLILLGHWTIYFSTASLAAIALHVLWFPFLAIVEADYSPRIGPLMIVLVSLYCITAIFSFREIRRSLYSGSKGDVL